MATRVDYTGTRTVRIDTGEWAASNTDNVSSTATSSSVIVIYTDDGYACGCAPKFVPPPEPPKFEFSRTLRRKGFDRGCEEDRRPRGRLRADLAPTFRGRIRGRRCRIKRGPRGPALQLV